MKNMGGGGEGGGEGRRDYDWFGESLIIRIRARCENSNLFENDKNVENFGLSFIVEVWSYIYGIIEINIVIFNSVKYCSGLICLYLFKRCKQMLYFFDKVYQIVADEVIDILVRKSCNTYRCIENKKLNTSYPSKNKMLELLRLVLIYSSCT